MHQTRVAIGSERLFAKSKWQTRVISYLNYARQSDFAPRDFRRHLAPLRSLSLGAEASTSRRSSSPPRRRTA